MEHILKFKWLSVLGGIGVSTAIGFALAEKDIWIVLCLLCFAGTLLFDRYFQVTSKWSNCAIFLLIYGALIHALTQPDTITFFRSTAGAILFLSMAFEMNSLPWTGKMIYRSPFFPAFILFIFTLAQDFPNLPPEAAAACSLLSILILCLFEVFFMNRDYLDEEVSSFLSSVRMTGAGLVALVYGTNLSSQSLIIPFGYLNFALPGLGLVLGLLSWKSKDLARKYILFNSTWSLFLFWCVLERSPLKIGCAIAGLVIGVWTVMMVNKKIEGGLSIKEVLLKMIGFASPGTLMFSIFLFALFTSRTSEMAMGNVVWVVAFFAFWYGLAQVDWETTKKSSNSWDWRSSLALCVSHLGILLLAFLTGISIFISSLIERRVL
jgi:hypothetical protein